MAGTDPRRAAEQAARAALNDRIAAVGALGQAVARRTSAADGPADADAKAAELLTAARAEGQRLRQDARDAIAAADRDYADAHATALASGWSVEELTELGYPSPRRRRPTRPATSTPAAAGDADSADPAAHRHTDAL